MKLFWLNLGVCLFSYLACAPPCQKLAMRICNCLPHDSERQQCVRHVTALGRNQPHRGDTQVCSQALLSCSCESLQHQQYSSCALALE